MNIYIPRKLKGRCVPLTLRRIAAVTLLQSSKPDMLFIGLAK